MCDHEHCRPDMRKIDLAKLIENSGLDGSVDQAEVTSVLWLTELPLWANISVGRVLRGMLKTEAAALISVLVGFSRRLTCC